MSRLPEAGEVCVPAPAVFTAGLANVTPGVENESMKIWKLVLAGTEKLNCPEGSVPSKSPPRKSGKSPGPAGASAKILAFCIGVTPSGPTSVPVMVAASGPAKVPISRLP